MIPIIDFRPFLDGSDKQGVADQIMDSFKKVGFIYLVNYANGDIGVDGMFQWARKFFELPMDQKMLAPHPESGAHHRGYSPPGKEKVIQLGENSDPSVTHNPPDMKESFELGREDDPNQPNIWLPEDALPGFKEAGLGFFMACRSLQINVLRALAVGFGLSEDYFEKLHGKLDNQLRLLRYPEVQRCKLEAHQVNRISAHSDFDTFTLLFQDEVGGLEAEDPQREGVFVPVPPVPGSVVVNVGDFLMRWSNDMLKSTMHRVGVPSQQPAGEEIVRERYSIPYFCSVDMDLVVDCLPGTYSDERPKKYEPISAGEYVMRRLAANY